MVVGLSDDVRADYTVMKDVAVHTRIAPQGRQQTLVGFVQQMNRNEQVKKEMSGWGLRFGDNLLNVNARIMPQEKIFQANNQMVSLQ